MLLLPYKNSLSSKYSFFTCVDCFSLILSLGKREKKLCVIKKGAAENRMRVIEINIINLTMDIIIQVLVIIILTLKTQEEE